MEKSPIRYSSLSLAIKYNCVLFPFDAAQFIRALPSDGYALSEAAPGQPPLGTRLEVNGVIGRKGNIALRLDMSRQILAVHAYTPKDVLSEMDRIELLLKREFSIENATLALYYEVLADLVVQARKNPLTQWSQQTEHVSIVQKAGEAFGTPVALWGVRFTPQGESPNQANWLDIRLQPSIHAPTGFHSVEVVFRRARREEVFAFLRKFEETLTSLVGFVEKE